MASVEQLPAAVTPASLVMDGIRRTRELYHYVTPAILSSIPTDGHQDNLDTGPHPTSLTPSLVPLVQLVALRCDASKAILNVLDSESMYSLAQASKRPLAGSTDMPMFETAEDNVLMGCSTVPVSGRVCELTVRMHADKTNKFPMFVVPDMSKDPRFSKLDVVASGQFKFYAGTPITTREGVNIGSLAVMDGQPRDSLTDDEERCLGETAAHVMHYLALYRSFIEGRQARRMANGLSCFVSGLTSFNDQAGKSQSTRGVSVAATSYGLSQSLAEEEFLSSLSSENRRGHEERCDSDPRQNVPVTATDPDIELSDTSAKGEDSSSPESDDASSRSHSKSFARAANLIRESLELGDDGGVLFTAVTPDHVVPDILAEVQSESVAHAKLAQPVKPPTFMKRPRYVPATTIASSTKTSPLVEGDSISQRGVVKLDSEAVNYFVTRYPGGCVWTLEDTGDNSASEEIPEEGEPQKGAKPSSSRRRAAELEFLRQAFPNARQLLLTPLWDASQGRVSSACFVWSSTPSRFFSVRYELSYLTSFCQALMAECSRLDAMMADKQKSSFVGVISHELRSPLHGILASVDLLLDSNLNSFQDSIIQTIDACGKTLLDTINHVLDFSKINSFEKTWQASNRRKDRSRHKARSAKADPLRGSSLVTSAPPLLQLFHVTDISVILEEVLEGITAGQAYANNFDITDMSEALKGRVPISYSAAGEKALPSSENNAVEVLLDIAPGDWLFMTQPGAVRRLIMNIFGNAVKYTSRGTVKVRLELRDDGTGAEDRTMVLTVTDTGKGISQRFLSSKLFMPFAQENTLSPGTGLGLSICKSICLMLGGTIEIQSSVNSGTTVQVSLPLARPGGGAQSTTMTPQLQNTPNSPNASDSSGPSPADRSIIELTQIGEKCRVALYHSAEVGPHSSVRETRNVLERYITAWFGVQLASIDGGSPNVIILEEQDAQNLSAEYPLLLKEATCVVLCRNASRRGRASMAKDSILSRAKATEYLAKPCGPHKLAKAIRACLRKLEGSDDGISANIRTSSRLEPQVEIMDAMKEPTLGKLGDTDRIEVHATEPISASQTSQHVLDAIMNPSLEVAQITTSNESFPLPARAQPQSSGSTIDRSRRASRSEKYPSIVDGRRTSPSRVSEVTTLPYPSLKTADPRMLIVDDNAINRRLLHTYLTKRKCSRVDNAENGAVAVDLFTSAPPDRPYEIVFMDISMPVMDGFEATRVIREFEQRTTAGSSAMIIALTGLASEKDQTEGLASGCDIYMTKPVRFKEVGRLLDNFAANSRRTSVVEPAEALMARGVSEMSLQDKSMKV